MATVSSHSLPNMEKLFKPFGTVESYATVFFSYLEQMELFYNYMSTIDELCYVVDPMIIDTKCNHRLIKIGRIDSKQMIWALFFIYFFSEADDRVYIKVTVDPLVPTSITAVFFGPTKATEYYRNLYRERIYDWNTNDDIHRNLLRIFGEQFCHRIIMNQYSLLSHDKFYNFFNFFWQIRCRFHWKVKIISTRIAAFAIRIGYVTKSQ